MRPIWTIGRAIRFAILSAGALVMLAPYIWMISVSLKPRSEIFNATFELLPEHWGAVENYTKAMTRIPMLTLLGNGAIVCAAILLFQTVFAIPCAYALAKLRFRGAEPIFALVMMGLLIPVQTTALPIYVVFSDLNLLNSLSALVIPFMLSVFAIFLFRQFFRSMPDDLIHAARLDGMGELGIVWRVIVPNAWPAATAFAIFSVVAHWNDLFWPLIVITRMPLATPPLGLIFFQAAEAGDDYGALMAATTIVTLPLVLLFLFAQRRFIEGITLSGLKG
ncbi:MAG TPA: carbohydrate ABC transporter permease [Stellaceae bacterium]|nr:carbohydrate ABC transporter permease [Stellaceae bacterium]